MHAPPAPTGPVTIAGAVRLFEEEGYSAQMGARPGGRVMCFSCRKESDAHEVRLEASHRMEGVSDPAEMAMVAAVVCPSCGARGTLVLSYGPVAAREDGDVLLALEDRRFREDAAEKESR